MSNSNSKVARRYARALFELCEPKDLETMRGWLNSLTHAWADSSQLRETLSNPALAKTERTAVILAVGQKITDSAEAKLSERFGNFLNLLFENNRLGDIADIAQAFSGMVDEFKKILALEIVSACNLEEGEKNSVLERLQKEYGSLVSIDWQIDRAILGGLLIKSGDRLLDASVQGSLDRIKENLLNG